MQKPFQAERFTPTKFYSAEVKAKFGNDLVKFILNGFQWKDFSKSVYERLSNCFGHIAHYDRRGFFQRWFSDTENIKEWVEWVTECHPVGSPEFTFSDVEREIQSWFFTSQQDIQSVLNDYGQKQSQIEDQEGNEVEFIIAAVSDNTGDFGHKEHIVIGRNGIAFKGYRQPSAHGGGRDLVKGDTLKWEVNSEGMPKSLNETFETVSKMPDPAPQAVVDEVFADSHAV